MCNTGRIVCSRLSAESDEYGGCEKVRDFSSAGIEKYPWIRQGYETFATKYDCFVVTQCDHFRVNKPRPAMSTSEKNAIKLSLAQFRFDDI